MGLTPAPPERRDGLRPPGDRSTLAALGITALAVLCCGLPLLAAAVVASGAGSWLAARGSLLALPVLGVAAGLLWWGWRRSRS